jgi:hypothetical protein
VVVNDNVVPFPPNENERGETLTREIITLCEEEESVTVASAG